MKNKSGIIALTGTLLLICLYYLSFTFVARHFRSQADAYATGRDGRIDFNQKQRYLDSLWNVPVYLGNTLQQVAARELSLGLDLQGGMHVVLEVMPEDIISGMAGGNSSNQQFRKALKTAAQNEAGSTKSFTSLFVSAYEKENPGKPLAALFANSTNREKISGSSTNKEVQAALESEFDQAVDVAFKIIRARVDQFGVANPNIQRLPNSNRIMVELPGADNPERVRKLLSGSASLEFVEMLNTNDLNQAYTSLAGYMDSKAKAGRSADTLSANTDDRSLEGRLAAKNDADTAANTRSGKAFGELFTATPQGLYVKKIDTARVNHLLASSEVRAFFPSDAVFLWGKKEMQAEQTQEMLTLHIAKKKNGQPAMDGSVIVDARSDYDQTGRPEVTMQMNGAGARRWKQVTAANVGRQIGIVLDDQVYTAPVVNGEIPNGMSSITGNFTVEETKDLANVLKAGKLPAPTRIIEEAVIGSTLGTEAISSGIWSCLIGLCLVLTFMAVYYSKAGWVANLALVINLVLLLGVMASLGSVLTLAGIAGIVLTIGMSVDANVLIYEGIKAELDEGKPFALAVKDGFRTSLTAIFDSNATVLITGLILFMFGSGLILGFATTLIIGIMTSLFSAIVITKLLLDLRVARGGSLQFHSALTRNWFKDTQFDFISQRKRFYRIAVVVLIIGAASFIFKGFGLGIDFKGGRSYVIRYEKRIDTEEVRRDMAKALGEAYLEVKTYGGLDQVKVTTDYGIDNTSPAFEKSVSEKILKAANNNPSNKGAIQSATKVGPTVAFDTMLNAGWAVVFALAATFLYIFIRFGKVAFGFGALLALLHDVFVLLAIFSLFNGWLPFSLDIDQAFIGAVLTVMGYSMNDKIVIFDKVRNYLADPATRHQDIPTIINNALNKTLNRTAVTGITTMMVLIVLLIFGGQTLRGFTFAMLIGVIVGTYSSLFIATPIVVDALIRKGHKIPEPQPVKPRLAKTPQRSL